MSLWTYLRGHVPSTAVGLAGLLLLWPLLRLVGLNAQLATLLTLLAALALAAMGTANWLHARSWHRAFAEVAAAEDDALDLVRGMPEPEAPEAQAPYEALQAVASQANARLGDLRQREREHREFVEAWVHEVKTPLAAADLMIENLDDPRLAPLARELRRVDAYVEQALFFARSSSVENDYLVRSCNLGDLVRDAVKARAQTLVEARVAVGLHDLDRTVFADAKWMGFVLGQLIDNAVRYRRPQGACIDFAARTLDEGRADERVVLAVRDNGCGISAADVGRVFEKGFTGENGRTHGKSTGIGLYLVRSLCVKMGLSVAVSSVQGEWTCVEVAFPTNRMRMPD